MSSTANIPAPRNEPVLPYAPGSAERFALKAALAQLAGERTDIPVVIGGRTHRGQTHPVTAPHCHARVLGDVHQATPELVTRAVEAAL